MRKVTIASIKEPVILAEACSRRVAELCTSGLFNMCGQIDSKYSSISSSDTNFIYNVISTTIKKNQIDTARAFCKGIKYAMR